MPPSDAAQVLVVVINFNGLADTLACLDSLTQQTSKQFSVLVLDNGSRTDETPEIRARFPQYEVTRLEENLGWAGGNNLAMRQAMARGCSHVCLLNNDTVLDADVLERLLEADRLIGEPSLLHPAIAYFEDEANWQINPEQPCSTFPVPRVFPPASGIVEMGNAYGTCLLVPRAVLETVGLLDERFFLQLEETDFFYRTTAAGYRSFCARHARILHKQSASFGGRITPGKTYYQVRNTLLLTEKHSPGPRGFLRRAQPAVDAAQPSEQQWRRDRRLGQLRALGGLGGPAGGCGAAGGGALPAAALRAAARLTAAETLRLGREKTIKTISKQLTHRIKYG